MWNGVKTAKRIPTKPKLYGFVVSRPTSSKNVSGQTSLIVLHIIPHGYLKDSHHLLSEGNSTVKQAWVEVTGTGIIHLTTIVSWLLVFVIIKFA